MLSSGMIRCRVARRASWVARGLGRRGEGGFELVLVDYSGFRGGDANRLSGFGSRVRG